MKVDSQDIRDRSFAFGCDVVKAVLNLPPRPGIRNIVDQLLKAGTSVGANLEEAKASCAALELAPSTTLSRLIDEGGQIARILGAIVVSTKRRLVLTYGAVVLCFAVVPFLPFAF